MTTLKHRGTNYILCFLLLYIFSSSLAYEDLQAILLHISQFLNKEPGSLFFMFLLFIYCDLYLLNYIVNVSRELVLYDPYWVRFRS